MGNFLFGALTTAAANAAVSAAIPALIEAQNVSAQIQVAADADLIAKATALLQVFFSVRKLAKENKVRITALDSGVVPTDIVTKNNEILVKTDNILYDLYNANGKQLLPYQDPNDTPLLSVAVDGLGTVGPVTLSVSDINAMAKSAKDISDVITRVTGRTVVKEAWYKENSALLVSGGLIIGIGLIVYLTRKD